LQPRKFYANISVKPHISTLSVLTVCRVSCDPLHDGHCRCYPAASFTPYFHRELHSKFDHTNQIRPFTQQLPEPLN
jgi:hypothetical protein